MPVVGDPINGFEKLVELIDSVMDSDGFVESKIVDDGLVSFRMFSVEVRLSVTAVVTIGLFVNTLIGLADVLVIADAIVGTAVVVEVDVAAVVEFLGGNRVDGVILSITIGEVRSVDVVTGCF